MHINKKYQPLIKATLFTLCGAVASFIGLIIGVLLGGEFRRYHLWFQYGGLSGYEGIVIFGGLVGIAAISILFITLWFRRSNARKGMIIFFLISWIIAVILECFYAIIMGDASSLSVLSPIILTGILYARILYSKKSKIKTCGFKIILIALGVLLIFAVIKNIWNDKHYRRNIIDYYKENFICAEEGESIAYCPGCKSKCCEGLRGMAQLKYNGECYLFGGGFGATCSNCGNGICDTENNEDECNCSEDCK